jgi:hypothetical protein
MSSRTVGYIVTWEGHPTWVSRRKDARGVLFLSRPATLFPSRRAAQRAIEVSKSYAAENAMPWSDDYRILRVEAA